MTQLELRLKDDKTAHYKALERELEQFKHQCERDSDKLRMRIRMELENRVSLYTYMCICTYLIFSDLLLIVLFIVTALHGLILLY